MFNQSPVWAVYIAYIIYVLIKHRSLTFFLKRVTHATLFSLTTVLGFMVTGNPIEWAVVIGPGFLFFTTYILNAFYDQEEDQANGRTLELDFKHQFLQYMFIIAFLGSFIEDGPRFMMFTGLFVLTELYHNPKIRLKRVVGFQTLSEGLGAGLCFSLAGWHYLAIGYAVIFGLLSQMKDVSDWAGDAKAKIWTLFGFLVDKKGLLTANDLVNNMFMAVVKFSLGAAVILIFIAPSYPLFYGILLLVVVHEGFSVKEEEELYGQRPNSEVNLYYANLLLLGQMGTFAALGSLL